MNICGNGICVCEGGSDVIGEDSSCSRSQMTFAEQAEQDRAERERSRPARRTRHYLDDPTHNYSDDEDGPIEQWETY